MLSWVSPFNRFTMNHLQVRGPNRSNHSTPLTPITTWYANGGRCHDKCMPFGHVHLHFLTRVVFDTRVNVHKKVTRYEMNNTCVI